MTFDCTFKILEESPPSAPNIDDIKSYLRITYDYDNEFLLKLRTRAIAYAENFLRYSIIQKKVLLKDSPAPSLRAINCLLPLVYCSKVESVRGFNQKGGVDFDKDSYSISKDKSFLRLKIKDPLEKIKIVYYTSNLLTRYAWLQQGIMQHISDMYDRKENYFALQSLYQPYRRILL